MCLRVGIPDCRDVARHVAETRPPCGASWTSTCRTDGIRRVTLLRKAVQTGEGADDGPLFGGQQARSILAGADGYLLNQTAPGKPLRLSRRYAWRAHDASDRGPQGAGSFAQGGRPRRRRPFDLDRPRAGDPETARDGPIATR